MQFKRLTQIIFVVQTLYSQKSFLLKTFTPWSDHICIKSSKQCNIVTMQYANADETAYFCTPKIYYILKNKNIYFFICKLLVTSIYMIFKEQK